MGVVLFWPFSLHQKPQVSLVGPIEMKRPPTSECMFCAMDGCKIHSYATIPIQYMIYNWEKVNLHASRQLFTQLFVFTKLTQNLTCLSHFDENAHNRPIVTFKFATAGISCLWNSSTIVSFFQQNQKCNKRVMFYVSKSELRCKSLKQSKWGLFFSF